jgi:UDP-glucose 4-epimerase
MGESGSVHHCRISGGGLYYGPDTAVDFWSTMSDTVLVTGAAGFIGAHVAEHCEKLGMRVIGLDDLSGGFVENVPRGTTFVQGSVTDVALIERLFGEHDFRYVYHLAAYAAEGLSHFIRRYNYETNLIGSVNLVNEAVKHNVRCFVFTSSIAVYGANQTPMTEELTPLPEDPYGVSKYAVELDLKAAHEMFALPFIVFRPHNVYGEKQNIADRYRNVIGIFMNQVMQGQGMTIFGDGTQTRAFSHIDDVAPIIARGPLVSGAYNQVFNVGADQPYSVNELADEVARAFGASRQVEYLPARNEVLHAFSSHEKVARIFETRPSVTLRGGIERMTEWAKRRGPTPPVLFRNIEVRKNLPPSWDV